MNNVPQPMPGAIPATQPLTATLEAREWDVVMQGLAELPLKISNEIFGKLMQQLRTQSASNGDAHAEKSIV